MNNQSQQYPIIHENENGETVLTNAKQHLIALIVDAKIKSIFQKKGR